VPLNKKGRMKGASNPGKEWVGEVGLKQIYEIALVKQTVSARPIQRKRGC